MRRLSRLFVFGEQHSSAEMFAARGCHGAVTFDLASAKGAAAG